MARLADPGLALRRRRQILEAALYCFRRRGFHQATMQEICAEAGISPGALYRYFASKSDIIAAIAEDEHRDGGAMLSGETREGGFLEGLGALAGHFFARCMEEGHASIFADVLAEAARDPHLAARLTQIDAQRIARLSEAMRAAQARGEIDPQLDARAAAQILMAAMAGLATRHMLIGGDSAAATADFRTLAARFLTARAQAAAQ
ncbi:MAG: TetR/AcrR family transcriptional regulator [Hyphomonadaceae bacterium]